MPEHMMALADGTSRGPCAITRQRYFTPFHLRCLTAVHTTNKKMPLLPRHGIHSQAAVPIYLLIVET
eukprot:1162016-Pelagomonas_calceolata.AAC.20